MELLTFLGFSTIIIVLTCSYVFLPPKSKSTRNKIHQSLLWFKDLLTILKLCPQSFYSSSKLPPGPYRYPIIGNILELRQNTHQSLVKLSKIYGPLMYLKLGNIATIVISSPELAKEVLLKHDHCIYGRANPAVSEIYSHDKVSMIWLPTNDKRWRVLRKICKHHIFSQQRLDETRCLRQESLRKMCDYMQECCHCGLVVDISRVAMSISLNLITSTLFSRDLSSFVLGSDDSQDAVMEIVHVLIEGISTANIADYFPVLKFMDPQGIKRRAKAYVAKFFAILDDIISQRLEEQRSISMDLLDDLLAFSQKNESELPQNQIKHLLMDLILAGTEATAITVEWMMAELIRNPEKMAKARNEIRTSINHHEQVQESDISRLVYLNAVFKESIRLHPVGPLLIPHKAEADVEMCGYFIPKDAYVMINIWDIGRDPRIWPNPERFEPERFVGSKIEFKGHDFELIPFGSGRRICPGLPLANRMVPLVVAHMIHYFNWKLEGEKSPEELDMNEKFAFSLHKDVPLNAIPIKS